MATTPALEPLAPPEALPAPTRTGSHLWRVIRRDPLALMSTVIILAFIFISIFARQIAPYPAQGAGATNPETSLLPPSLAHPFGADVQGRDMLSRVIIGTPLALL